MGLSLAMVPVVLYPVLKDTMRPGPRVCRLQGRARAVTYLMTVIVCLLLLALGQGSTSSGSPRCVRCSRLRRSVGEACATQLGLSGFAFCLGALMFYAVLFQSRLIPRWLSGWGSLRSS